MKRALLFAAACALGCDSGFAVGVTVELGCLQVPPQLQVLATAEPGQRTSLNLLDGGTFFAPGGQHRLVVLPPDGATAVKVQVIALDQKMNVLGEGEVTVAVEGHALVERTLPLSGSCNDGFVFSDLTMPDLAMPDLLMPDLSTVDRGTGCVDPGDCTQGVTPRCCFNSCVDVDTDKGNCGACGAACNLPNAVSGCMGGQCKFFGCLATFGDCNNNPADGCETSTSTDPQHCGACNVGCAAGANVAQVGCQNGGCFVAACLPGFADCNKLPGDGCEVATDADPKNCGACGVTCLNGVVCAGGHCGRRVFVTGSLVNGALGGVDLADSFCQNAAMNAALGGTWQAWLSSANQDAAARFKTKFAGPYVRMDGAVIADNFNDLVTNGAKVPINLTQGKTPPPPSTMACNTTTLVWTATNPMGAWDAGGDCGNWMMINAQAGLGASDMIGMTWTKYCIPQSCSTMASLYCFEQ